MTVINGVSLPENDPQLPWPVPLTRSTGGTELQAARKLSITLACREITAFLRGILIKAGAQFRRATCLGAGEPECE